MIFVQSLAKSVGADSMPQLCVAIGTWGFLSLSSESQAQVLFVL